VTTAVQYPEHEKMQAIAEHSQEIGRFLDEFLPSKGIHLCVYSEERYSQGEFFPASRPITDLLAEFYEIDLDKIEDEKRAMLDSIRAAHP
jgi:hypothetical protein